VASCLLLALNIHQRTIGIFTSNIPGGRSRLFGKHGSGKANELSGPSGLGIFTGNTNNRGDKNQRELHTVVPSDKELKDSDKVMPSPEKRPWYMKDGKIRPQFKEDDELHSEDTSDSKIFPDDYPNHDRIPEQLMCLPPKHALPAKMDDANAPLKKILLWNGIQSWGGLRAGRGVFIKEKCPVNSCVISSSRLDSQQADLVLFKDHFTKPSFSRPTNQLWMMYFLECPLHTQNIRQKNMFNWTSTYRSDSTLVAPYERWQYYNDNVKQLPLKQNFAVNKTKSVAWFVSNCGARNGRLKYAKELGKYIEVDIYGSCGTKQCPRSKANDCFKMLERDYRFYLAFENSNCKDYITEKFFVNGLGHDLVPIVMGARPQDYERAAPYKSYIHVDDFEGPKELAEFLKQVESNDEVYNEYFRWKGTGEMINTKFFCRLCSLLHEPRSIKPGHHYEDFNEWWRGKGTCINGNWNKFYAALKKDREAGTVKKSSDPSKSSASDTNKNSANEVKPEEKAEKEIEATKEKQNLKGKDEEKSLDFEDLKP
jgi:glycoprotein 3-alpha-L-fucosyltransferase